LDKTVDVAKKVKDKESNNGVKTGNESKQDEKDDTSHVSTIDDIFEVGMKQAAKKKAERKEELKKKEEIEKKRRESKGKGKKKQHYSSDPKPLRYDAKAGMNIYSMESLGIGKGGDTDLCPFDCNCCF